MIDSVLKGTGNSRFLKSAVPAGTSWADALAMLQAGTFPIDFNGINTEGFQQVGTPLNKANLLKDATAAQIGLPPSTTPDGMFQALANTGELHVWRKTVTTAQEIPAGYTLGDVIENQRICSPVSGSDTSTHFNRAKAIKVSVDGKVSLDTSVGSWIGTPTIGLETLTVSDYFVSITGEPSSSDLVVRDVYYVPTGGSIILESNVFKMTKIQKVIGYPLTPAGTTTTYPVSTNPNAYQEGDDVKAAGYTLGDAAAMKLMYNGVGSGHYVAFNVSDSVSVTDSGEVSLVEKTSVAELTPNNTAQFNNMKGKFFVNRGRYQASTEIVDGVIYFIPDNATVSGSGDSGGSIITCDKIQPVTGYAAIPAGTTIEYLGKLGDKARVQVVSYVGTGTYGSSNPNSLTFDFAPKVVMFLAGYYVSNNSAFCYLDSEYYRDSRVVVMSAVKADKYTLVGFGLSSQAWAKKTPDGKTLFWYNTYNQEVQANISGVRYHFLAIG